MAGSSFIPEDFVAPNTTTITTTTEDMTEVFKYKKNKKLYGTFAKGIPALKRYRDDLDNAPKEKDYEKNVIYINIFKPVGKQLKDLKK